MSSIFRFMSFEGFVDMVQRQALAFVNPELWEDPYESFVIAAMKTNEGQEKVYGLLKKLGHEDRIPSFLRLQYFSTAIFGQSWTKLAESDALWRIYPNNNRSIRIEVLIENIKRLDGVGIYDIRYVKHMDLETELKELIAEDRKLLLYKTICAKRDAFSHEQEVRLLATPDARDIHQPERTKNADRIRRALEALHKRGEIDRAEYDAGIANLNEESPQPKRVKYIPFGHVSDFIHSVVLHPLAPDWFDSTVRTYCEKHSLNYAGRSKLYELEL